MANLERSAKTGSVELPACRLTVVNRPIGTLTLDPKNPRLHSHQQIRQIAHSIEAFGFNVPVLVDGQLKVIAGHGRVFACRHAWLDGGSSDDLLRSPERGPETGLHDRRKQADRNLRLG